MSAATSPVVSPDHHLHHLDHADDVHPSDLDGSFVEASAPFTLPFSPTMMTTTGSPAAAAAKASPSMPSPIKVNLRDATSGSPAQHQHVHTQARAHMRHSGSKWVTWRGVAVFCLLLSICSLLLHVIAGLGADYMLSEYNRLLSFLAVVGAAVAVPLTHGVAGSRKYRPGTYFFFQPFAGGMRYVVLQFLGWATYSLTLIGAVYLLFIGTKQVALIVVASVGVGGVLAQLFVLVSLHVFIASGSSSSSAKSTASTNASAGSSQAGTPLLSPLMSPTSAATSSSASASPMAHSTASTLTRRRAASTKEPETTMPTAATPTSKSTTTTTASPPTLELSWWRRVLSGSGTVGVLLTLLSIVLAVVTESSAVPSTDPKSPNGSSHLSLHYILTSTVLLGVPLTHVVTGRRASPSYSLFQPFEGGSRFVILQAIGWTLWFVAISSSVMSLWMSANHRYVSGLVTTSGVIGVLSQALVLVSLPYFDRRLTAHVYQSSRLIQSARWLAAKRRLAGVTLDDLQAKSVKRESTSTTGVPVGASAGVSAGGAIGHVGRPMLLQRADSLPELGTTKHSPHASAGSATPSFRTLSRTASLSVLPSAPVDDAEALADFRSIVASSRQMPTLQRNESSHQLVKALFADGIDSDMAAMISASSASPRAGETASDAPPTTMTATAEQAAEQAAADQVSVDGVEHGLLHDASQYVLEHWKGSALATSLSSLTWQEYKDWFALICADWKTTTWSSTLDTLTMGVVVSLFYLVPILGATLTLIPFLATLMYHDVWWVPTASAIAALAYGSTYLGRPQITGRRRWSMIHKNVKLWTYFERYFSATFVAEGKLDGKNAPYIFGFHPHGIYPYTALWATNGPSWRAAYPDVDVDLCGASIMFHSPLLRDVCMWSGGREVSATSIRYALAHKQSVMIVPGGQREMNHSRASKSKLVLVTRHKGFIRMAIENGCSLVPVLSLGETFCLENISVPSVQSWTLRHLGVAFPIVPFGRWYSPIANSVPVTVIVGEPIAVQQCSQPSQEEIDRTHKMYFDQLTDMFYRYREQAGFGECELVLSNH